MNIERRVAVVSIAVFLLLAAVLAVYAHGGMNEGADDEKSVDQQIKGASLNVVYIGTGIMLVLICFALMNKSKSNTPKVLIFGAMTVVILVTSVYVASSTIYLNLLSPSKGPVHWHADFEVWDCGQKLDMAGNHGLSGTPTLHDHGDSRIHMEGVPVNMDDASISKFFQVIGGKLTKDSLTLLMHGDIVSMRDDDKCNGAPGEMQVFVYKVSNPDAAKKSWIYTQT